MGMFLTRAVSVLFCVLVLITTISCARNGTVSISSKTRKVKRDSSTSPFHYNSFNNITPFGYQNQYPREYQSSMQDRGRHSLSPLFNFPDGTKLILTPEINIPVTEDQSPESSVDSVLRVQFPISVTFKQVEHKDTFSDSILSGKIIAFDNLENNEIDKQQHRQRLLSRKLRAVDSFRYSKTSSKNKITRKLGDSFGKPIENSMFANTFRNSKVFSNMGGETCPTKSFIDRRSILQKMEIFVGSFLGYRDNPKACLLRWACEMHENSEVAGHYGLLGEGALLAFSFAKQSRHCDTSNPALEYVVPFIKAEIAGKSGKCLRYTKKCSQPLFTV